MTITSITISRQQLAAVIQDWLNANVLRTPQHVTSYETDDGAVTIALAGEPPSEPPAAPTRPVQKQKEEPAAPTTAPKSRAAMPRRRLTDADISAIISHRHINTPLEIASALGVAKSVIAAWLNDHPVD